MKLSSILRQIVIILAWIWCVTYFIGAIAFLLAGDLLLFPIYFFLCAIFYHPLWRYIWKRWNITHLLFLRIFLFVLGSYFLHFLDTRIHAAERIYANRDSLPMHIILIMILMYALFYYMHKARKGRA